MAAQLAEFFKQLDARKRGGKVHIDVTVRFGEAPHPAGALVSETDPPGGAVLPLPASRSEPKNNDDRGFDADGEDSGFDIGGEDSRFDADGEDSEASTDTENPGSAATDINLSGGGDSPGPGKLMSVTTIRPGGSIRPGRAKTWSNYMPT